jgi:hypothetical protein
MKVRKSDKDAALLEKGREAIGLLEIRDPSALDILEQYVAAFAAWEVEWGSRIGEKSLGSSDRAVLKALGEEVSHQHSIVIHLASEMKDFVANSLRSLKRRGKGLRAYSGHLPKRISTTKGRKG